MERELKPNDKRVVVVEDDPTFLSFWGRLLRELGLKDVRLFADPVEAGLWLDGKGADLLVSDIVMPDRNGYDLARLARVKDPECQVILTTAYSTDLSRFQLAGCSFHLLHKPYTDLTALKRFVRHILEGDSAFDDLSEESSSENEDYPEVTEWKL